MVLLMLVAPIERLLALDQRRQSNVLLALQQCKALLLHGIH
jgi:hypothetical protein